MRYDDVVRYNGQSCDLRLFIILCGCVENCEVEALPDNEARSALWGEEQTSLCVVLCCNVTYILQGLILRIPPRLLNAFPGRTLHLCIHRFPCLFVSNVLTGNLCLCLCLAEVAGSFRQVIDA